MRLQCSYRAWKIKKKVTKSIYNWDSSWRETFWTILCQHSHIFPMVSFRQWSGTKLRARHLQRFLERRRISLLLWISFAHSPGCLCHSLNSFFFLVFLYGAVSGAHGLYLAQVLYTNTRPYVTIKNASNRFLRYTFSTFLNDGFTRIPLSIFEIQKNVWDKSRIRFEFTWGDRRWRGPQQRLLNS